MEFLDEYDEGRPRFIFQSRPISSPSLESPQNSHKNKPLLFTSLTFSLLFLISSFFFLHSQLLHSLFLWLFLSLLVGPFAPLSLTLGDIRVGRGPVVEFPPTFDGVDENEYKRKVINRRNKGRRLDVSDAISNGLSSFVKDSDDVARSQKEEGGGVVEETEWSEEDLGLLRKQISKNPVGKPRRWEVIAEVFEGRHSVESVIKEAKFGLGKAKPDDSDSYSRFLKDRKPVDKRADDGGSEEDGGREVCVWSSGEDIALLNALKAFPKEVAMRWEKIAAAVPGKSKVACMKRVGELKKEFRSSKASSES